MEIVEVEINKIKPDPKQPRTSIDETDLREMAQSILTEGVINPIELDKKLVIITGERRWRAAEIAGLKTIPAKILDLNPEERFMRQVIENIHHNTMSDWDTANALDKLVTEYLFHGVKQIPREPGRPDKGITWLSQKTGKSTAYIAEKFGILEASKPIQKAIKEGKIVGTFVRATKRTPEKYREAVEKKILSKEIESAEGALSLALALKREEGNPEVVKELLETDYSKCKSDTEIDNVIRKISPKLHEKVAASYEPSKEISRIVDDLKEWVENNPRAKVGLVHAPRIIVNMNFAKTLIEKWFKGEEGKLLGK